jgi:HEPN domain-containing protein
MRLEIFQIIKRVTKERIIQIYEAASAGILRPQLAANMLSEVCETALELFKIVEQQNVRLKKLDAIKHDQATKTS